MHRPYTVWFLTAFMIMVDASGAPRAQIQVDLALVLAVDVSSSMDSDEQKLQRQGYVDAFRSPQVPMAIRTGMHGSIAVIYMDWSGAFDQRIVVPWTVIADPEQARLFAERLSIRPIRTAYGGTSISGGIDAARHLLQSAPFVAGRWVIDISGDGRNNHGRPLVQARDEAVLNGITINGLALVLKRPDERQDPWTMDRYYADCVIGGEGAFMVPVRERGQFAEAIKTKIVREIADRPSEPLVRAARTEPLTDCREGASDRSMR